MIENIETTQTPIELGKWYEVLVIPNTRAKRDDMRCLIHHRAYRSGLQATTETDKDRPGVMRFKLDTPNKPPFVIANKERRQPHAKK
jgi:phosphopantetheinyl transferase